ncbi:hypothetical protein JAO78_005865 [Alishewanella sp. 16-MA]|uniref:DUF945 domain-containing protein n=1 Tax=Alishewanella maricola TaxID=2795740 RepID=A0ABS8C2H6_9ALTE|nr:hypothetical protein [Alishewanella maricola]MCB5226335.1 hypothetical protein [Alishewanella maricola]
MRKSKLLLGIGLAAVVCVAIYQYVNYKAAKIIGQQIDYINQSYAEMASAGLMPRLSLSYQRIKANYWQDDYRIEGVQVDVAAVGVLAEVAQLKVRGFEPGTLADNGQVSIVGLKLSDGMQVFLPPELAKLAKGLLINTDYQYHYSGKSGNLRLTQQLYIGEGLSVNFQLQMQKMQRFWQFAKQWTAMDAETQQVFSQSDAYSQQLTQALTEGLVAEGQLSIVNAGFLQALYQALRQTEQTAQVEALKGQLEQFLTQHPSLPSAISQPLLVFLADPRTLTFQFKLEQPLSFVQLQQGEWPEQVQSAEQMLEFGNMLLQVNPE